MHHWLSVLSVLSTVLLANLAAPPAPLWGDVRVMHTRESIPDNWESLGPPPAGTTINLCVALKPHNEDALIDALYEVSDPGHQKYGAHLSKEQVAELVAPHQDTLEIVRSWLEHHGVLSSSISTSHGGGWLTITGVPVSQANELLCASYQLYRHTGTDETKAILRTVGYALPAPLHAHVQTVAPTTHFATPHTPLQTRRKHSNEEEAMVVNATSGEIVGALSKRDGHVTPPFLCWLYKTEAYVPAAADRNVLGVFGSQLEYPSQADLTHFMTDFRADAEAATFTVVQVNSGGHDSGNLGMEASIQMQYTAAMAYPTTHIYYNTSGQLLWSFYAPAPGDAYLEWLNYLISLPNTGIPRTMSISYADPEQGFSRAYTASLCHLFAQLGTRGVSVIVASGNDGVGPNGDCTNNKGFSKFTPMFPASCPWVTSVGGTTGHEPEIAASFSGGGFSQDFVRPKYQNYAVPPYLWLSLSNQKYKGFYKRGGRGIPDIASQAQRFAYILGGVYYEMTGTICSTSTVAGIVSLLNDYQILKGRAPLGFLNPWLYGISLADLEGFNDITSGSNPGCNTAGFSATTDWDPVTGLGTLDFVKLQRILDTRCFNDLCIPN